MKLESNEPTGDIANRWDKHRFDMKLVNPANKRKLSVIVVGSGLAGAAASATMAELGYNVDCFCFQDSPGALTRLRLKVASTLPRTTKTMAIAFTDSFTTPSKAVTFAHVNQRLSTGSSKPTSSTNVSLKAFRLLVTTVVILQTALSVVHK